jgi:hypothetical protein
MNFEGSSLLQAGGKPAEMIDRAARNFFFLQLGGRYQFLTLLIILLDLYEYD